MNYSGFKIWFIVTFSIAVITVIIRSIWQIVVIPTPGTMLIFIPLILALLGMDALLAYLIINPHQFRSRPFLIGIIIALTGGLVAGVTHFVRFIVSPLADPFLCKVIGYGVVLSGVSAYLLTVSFLWSLRRR